MTAASTEEAPHYRVVVEDARRSVLPREDAALVGKIDARRIDEVDDWRSTAHGNLLRAKDLSNGLRPPGTGFYRSIIGYDHDLATGDDADACDNAGAWSFTVVLIVGEEKTDLLKVGLRIEEP
jgi:hypothetical protein